LGAGNSKPALKSFRPDQIGALMMNKSRVVLLQKCGLVKGMAAK